MTGLIAAGFMVLQPGTPRSPPCGCHDESEVAAVIAQFKAKDPGLAKVFASAAGYAVFPKVGKGGLGLGGARGKGWVYQRGRLIGRSTLTQVTIGLQLGGQVYSEVVLMHNPSCLPLLSHNASSARLYRRMQDLFDLLSLPNLQMVTLDLNLI
jgi:hypothetical protein